MPLTGGLMMGKHPITPDKQERLDRVRELLRVHSSAKVRALIGAEFGIKSRQASYLIADARAQIREEAKVDREQEIADTLDQLNGIILSPHQKTSDRLKAITTKIRMLGLNAPVRLQFQQPLFDAAQQRALLQGLASNGEHDDLPAEHAGEALPEGLAVPKAPETTPASVHPAVNGRCHQQVGGADPC